MTHICVVKLTIIGSDDGLSPGRRQTIIWTNAGILVIRTLGTKLCEFLSEIHAFSFKKMHLKMSSATVWWQFCFGLNVLWLGSFSAGYSVLHQPWLCLLPVPIPHRLTDDLDLAMFQVNVACMFTFCSGVWHAEYVYSKQCADSLGVFTVEHSIVNVIRQRKM